MVRPYDILIVIADESKFKFLEAVSTIDAAMDRVKELAGLRHAEYQIYSHITGSSFPLSDAGRVPVRNMIGITKKG